MFIDKYGEPHSVQHDLLQNQAGAQYEQETLQWLGWHLGMQLSKYGATVDHGRFILVPKSTLEEDTEKRVKENRDALK